jgi:ATP adenylyltransferase
MKILWAPWRIEYVTANNEKGECIFCPGDDRGHDEERLILHVGDRSIVLMNRFPYINGHLLVAPVRHVPVLDALTDEEKLHLINMVERSIGILTEVMNPGGFNVGLNLGRIAGAGVEDHIHFHVVPRWTGDTNYMTVVGDVRVIPEHIQATYKKLLPLFKDL